MTTLDERDDHDRTSHVRTGANGGRLRACEADADGRRSIAPWIAVAFAAHAATFSIRVAHPAAATRDDRPLAIELLSERPVEPAPRPAPVHRTATDRDAPKEHIAAPAKARAAPHPTGPAHAGRLLTATESNDPGDTVSFVTDPNGSAYASGVVARGGTGTGDAPAATRAVAPAAPAQVPRGDVITPASDLTRAPALVETDACRGFFPRDAVDDAGQVTLAVVVRGSGQVATATILDESPARDGFGVAARTCLLAKRFAPALDREGRPATAKTHVRIHFSR